MLFRDHASGIKYKKGVQLEFQLHILFSDFLPRAAFNPERRYLRQYQFKDKLPFSRQRLDFSTSPVFTKSSSAIDQKIADIVEKILRGN